MLFSRSENSEFKQRRRKSKPIAEYPYFVPMLVVWGAALAGLIVMVLPASIINQITTTSALGALGEYARLFYAVLAGAFGAACGFFAATKWRDALPGRADAMISRSAEVFRPIDPAEDLGSESLDAPIEEIPATEETLEEDVLVEEPVDPAELELIDTEEADDTLELDAEFEAGPEPEPQPEPEPEPAPNSEPVQRSDPEPEPVDPLKDEHCEPAPDASILASKLPLRRRRNRGNTVELVQALGDHRARHAAMHKDQLDLGEFTQMAARNRSAESRRAPGEFTHTPTAIEKLRAVPPKELSLVQMVERLAVALHERQEAAHTRPASEQATERDAALAEALKALAVFTEKGLETPKAPTSPPANAASDETESELRDALSKLQTLQGAA